LLAQVDVAPTSSHFGEMLREAMEARAERLLNEAFQRIGWSKDDLPARHKGDPHKMQIAQRTAGAQHDVTGLDRRAPAHGLPRLRGLAAPALNAGFVGGRLGLLSNLRRYNNLINPFPGIGAKRDFVVTGAWCSWQGKCG
jgi:hypothetical protein